MKPLVTSRREATGGERSEMSYPPVFTAKL
jgi:hypothetical protein